MKDFRTRLALEWSMGPIGEAARRVSKKFRGEHEEIPWKGIIGCATSFAHEYGELDHNRLYTVARDGVPELIQALEKIIGKKKRNLWFLPLVMFRLFLNEIQ